MDRTNIEKLREAIRKGGKLLVEKGFGEKEFMALMGIDTKKNDGASYSNLWDWISDSDRHMVFKVIEELGLISDIFPDRHSKGDSHSELESLREDMRKLRKEFAKVSKLESELNKLWAIVGRFSPNELSKLWAATGRHSQAIDELRKNVNSHIGIDVEEELDYE